MAYHPRFLPVDNRRTTLGPIRIGSESTLGSAAMEDGGSSSSRRLPGLRPRGGGRRRSNNKAAAYECELTPEEYEKMIGKLKAWAEPRTRNSQTATGLANARLIEKIADDGLVTKQDEHLIMNSFNCQRGWWQVLILMDTLIMAILFPVLIYEEPPDNGHFDEAMRRKLSLAYHTCLATSFYLAIIQLFVVLFLFALSSYLIQMKSILYLYIHCHTLFVYTNTGGMLIVPALILSAILGNVLMVGPYDSIPSAVLGTFTIIFTGFLYSKVLKPVFADIFNAKVGAWGGKEKKLKAKKVANNEFPEVSGHFLSMPFKSLEGEIGVSNDDLDLEEPWKDEEDNDPPPLQQGRTSSFSSRHRNMNKFHQRDGSSVTTIDMSGSRQSMMTDASDSCHNLELPPICHIRGTSPSISHIVDV